MKICITQLQLVYLKPMRLLFHWDTKLEGCSTVLSWLEARLVDFILVAVVLTSSHASHVLFSKLNLWFYGAMLEVLSMQRCLHSTTKLLRLYIVLSLVLPAVVHVSALPAASPLANGSSNSELLHQIAELQSTVKEQRAEILHLRRALEQCKSWKHFADSRMVHGAVIKPQLPLALPHSRSLLKSTPHPFILHYMPCLLFVLGLLS